MSRNTALILGLTASVVLGGCTGVPVRTDQNAQLLASVHCQSVGWAGGFKGSSPLRTTIANPLNEARLRDAIAADLKNAGLAISDAGTKAAPQCLIGYGIGMARELDSVYPDGYAYGGGAYFGGGWGRRGGWGGYGGWGGPGWGWGGAPYAYQRSFITVDLYDAASKNPMWHASAEQSLSGLTGDAATQRIRAAVDAIFVKFPK